MYGKIIDGKLVCAPNPMLADITNEETGEIARYKVYNPRPEQYEAEGYLEVIETEYPEASEGDADKYYEKRYIERDGKIYGEWVETEAPEAPEVPEPTPTLEERTSALEENVAGLSEELEAAKIILGVE